MPVMTPTKPDPAHLLKPNDSIRVLLRGNISLSDLVEVDRLLGSRGRPIRNESDRLAVYRSIGVEDLSALRRKAFLSDYKKALERNGNSPLPLGFPLFHGQHGGHDFAHQPFSAAFRVAFRDACKARGNEMSQLNLLVAINAMEANFKTQGITTVLGWEEMNMPHAEVQAWREKPVFVKDEHGNDQVAPAGFS